MACAERIRELHARSGGTVVNCVTIFLYFTKPCVTVKKKRFIITSVVLATLAIVFIILYFTEIFLME